MSKIKKELEILSSILEFELSDDELDKIEGEYTEIETKLNLIKNFDVKNVKETNFVHQPLVDPILREDVEVQYDSKSVFANCTNFDGKYVVIKYEK